MIATKLSLSLQGYYNHAATVGWGHRKPDSSRHFSCLHTHNKRPNFVGTFFGVDK